MSESGRKQAMQMAVLVLAFCAAANIAFYFLADLYFEDRARRFGENVHENISSVRVAFAIFTASLGVAAILAAMQPRLVGHGIAGIAALASLVAAVGASAKDMPIVLPAALVLLALVIPALIWRSLAGSRGAWSFLIGLCAVYGLILLFGAPKVRELFGVGLWHAFIVPGLLTVGVVALVMQRASYGERASRPTR